MKKILLSCLLILILDNISFAQSDLPPVKIRNLAGQELSFRDVVSLSDTAVIVSLWATWCVPCIEELETISEQFDQRMKESTFRFLAISIDDSRTVNRVKPFVKGKGWPFEIFLDVNSELKRALNINDVPHILIIKNGKIVYQHNGYVSGNEEELFQKLKSI